MKVYRKRRTRKRPVKVYDRYEPEHNYLKHWRVVRYWAKAKYELSTADLDMLLFLYSEGLFTRLQCQHYGMLMSWDKLRFEKLLRNGWIKKWRNKTWTESALYEISYKGKKLVNSIYKKLNGEEKISEEPRNNPIFNNRICNSTDKIYRHAIRNFNKEVKA